jgi:hypothetical protein
MQIRGDVLYTLYFDDTWGGEKVFKSGNRILIQLLSQFKLGSTDAGFFIRERIKGKNTTGSGKTYTTERLNSNATVQIRAGPGCRQVRMRAKGLVDVKLYSTVIPDGRRQPSGVGGGGRFASLGVFNGDRGTISERSRRESKRWMPPESSCSEELNTPCELSDKRRSWHESPDKIHMGRRDDPCHCHPLR